MSTVLPDLTPCDQWLFPHIKISLIGNHFASAEIIQLTAMPSRASEGAYSNGRTAVASLYVQKGSISRFTRLGFIYLFLQIVLKFRELHLGTF